MFILLFITFYSCYYTFWFIQDNSLAAIILIRSQRNVVARLHGKFFVDALRQFKI
jgi:hypothetical protein